MAWKRVFTEFRDPLRCIGAATSTGNLFTTRRANPCPQSVATERMNADVHSRPMLASVHDQAFCGAQSQTPRWMTPVPKEIGSLFQGVPPNHISSQRFLRSRIDGDRTSFSPSNRSSRRRTKSSEPLSMVIGGRDGKKIDDAKTYGKDMQAWQKWFIRIGGIEVSRRRPAGLIEIAFAPLGQKSARIFKRKSLLVAPHIGACRRI